MRNRLSVKCKVKSACLPARQVKLRSFLILLMGLVCLILPWGPQAQAQDPLNLINEPFYGMQIIDAVQESSNRVVVTTSGAIYTVTSTSVQMQRRIDPKTNTVNPRLVATLSYGNIGSLTLNPWDKREAVITNPIVDFQFNSDSFFFIKAKESFSYTHRNLITDAAWAKPEPEFLESVQGRDRMWTDGYGGSLHAFIEGSPTAATSADSTYISMASGDVMAHMAYPPKQFDFDRLYGGNARPFVDFISSNDSMEDIMFGNNIDEYITDGFGIFLIWARFYSNYMVPGRIGEDPTLIDSDLGYQIIGYKINEPFEDLVRRFVNFAHDNGFKVMTYLSYPSGTRWNYPEGHLLEGQHQDIQVTLQWMRDFQEDYGFDGWYFDNADAGTLLEDYNFIRQVRTDIDDYVNEQGRGNGIIYHHDSVDVWDGFGNYRGLRAIMVDAYVDYTLTGETGGIAEVHSPNDPYFRFFTAGYGMSQAYASHKRESSMNIAISEQEKCRVLAENLNGVERVRTGSWLAYFKPFYAARKAEYSSINFNPDVDWPIDPVNGWFRAPANILVTYPTETEATIYWETNAEANSEAAYTSNGAWWPNSPGRPSGPDGEIKVDSKVTEHSIILEGLDPNKNYEFRIRSTNQQPELAKVIWGAVFGIDTDRDSLPDDWELNYFGNLDQGPDNDFDADQSTNLQEYQAGTDPTVPSIILGDVTGNGLINIADVQACVNIILFTEIRPDWMERADVTEADDQPGRHVNIHDLTRIILIKNGS